MKFVKRIKKLEDLRYIPDIPREELIQVITEMTPDEIEALRAELGFRSQDHFREHRGAKVFSRKKWECECDGTCRENGGCKCGS